VCGGCGVLGQPSFQRVSAQGGSVAAGEQRIVGRSAAFGHPGADDRGGCRGERGDALLTALAQAADVRSGVQADVCAGERGEFGGPQAGLDGEDQQGVITAPGPAGSVRGGEERGAFGLGEVGDEPAVKSLGRDRQDALDDGCVLWVLEGREAEECVYAARRALRVLTLLPRSVSRWSRNAPIKGASRSVISRREGALQVRWAAKASSNFSASR